MSLDKKTVLKIWLKPGLKLTIFRGTAPWANSPGKLDRWHHIQNSQGRIETRLGNNPLKTTLKPINPGTLGFYMSQISGHAYTKKEPDYL